jgi:2,5-diketo-D-gluconate reductase A
VSRAPSYQLDDGAAMPALGFGTYPLRGRATGAVAHALDLGYRLIDTAAAYENEQDVGRAIRSAGTPRHDLFVVSKLPGGPTPTTTPWQVSARRWSTSGWTT